MEEFQARERDALQDFVARDFAFEGNCKVVLVSGKGPAVIVMAEMPGISPEVARFARWVRDAGFTVYMPVLFGDPGRPIMALAGLYSLGVIVKACISREFHAFRANSSGPIAQWLRALARVAFAESGGKGVGAIGMCFTGNFALSMMLEPAVLAPVLSQPSLPVNDPAGLHIAPEELQAVKARMDAEDLSVLAYRFSGDAFCKAARFDAYQAALGDRFIPVVLDDASAAPGAASNPHSVVTQHLIDKAGEPTRQAVDDIIAFFVRRLQ
ncbi:dienelactone hydrolase [Solimonas terrae]|uniref:Dienelactone hydrolase n=2 Tax=Solimonas terrae TaxID=1396819 RepID=A0A6M2BP65_9GAMM|nr:dienelactone hydrolase [Solimonas terrae]